jgi:hypothetical protein
MPFLVTAATGLPLQAPTYWIVSKRRPSASQPNTLLVSSLHRRVLLAGGSARQRSMAYVPCCVLQQAVRAD